MPEEKKKTSSQSTIAIIVIAIILLFLIYPNSSFNSGSGSDSTSSTNPILGVNTPAEEGVHFKILQNTCNVYFSRGLCQIESIIVVENTSAVDLYLSNSKCDVEDSNGNLVGSKNFSPYPDVIAPGEKAVFYGVSNIDNGTVDEKYVVIPKIRAEKAKVSVERLSVSDFTLAEDYYGRISYVGRVENTTDEKQSLYRVAVILYNESNEVIGLDYTYPDTIGPGEKTSFESSFGFNYFGLEFDSIARYEVIAFTYQLQF